MGKFEINYNNDDAVEILDSICNVYDYENKKKVDETKVQFAKRMLVEFVKNCVIENRREIVIEQAEDDILDINIT